MSRRSIVAGILLVHAGLLAWSGWSHSPTTDEVGHLPAGISHWTLRRFDLYNVNPPLVRAIAAIPVVLAGAEVDFTGYPTEPGERPEWDIGRRFLDENGPRAFWYFTIARWACIPFSLIGGVFCYRWGRELYGTASGIVALVLWCSSPFVLGHASMITPDIPAAALGLASAYFFWRWLGSPGWARALAAGGALGLAELTKSTWIVLFAIWPLIWICVRARQPGRSFRRELLQLGGILLLAVYLLNLGYGFERSFTRLGDFQFISQTLGGPEALRDGTGNRFSETWTGCIPVPLPANYVLGVDMQKRDFENAFGQRPSYLRGEWRDGGWWYFYVYMLAVKMPLGTMGLLAIALLVPRFSSGWRDELQIWLPAAVVLVLVSSQTGFTENGRYVFPMLGFLFVGASRAARAIAANGRVVATAAVASTALAVSSSLWTFPHSLAYFNEIAGGPRGGSEHLLQSNIDWGQDLFYLRDWLRRHPASQPLSISCAGIVDAGMLGIKASSVPEGLVEDSPQPARIPEKFGPRPGWHVVSADVLRRYARRVLVADSSGTTPNKTDYSYLQPLTPVAMAGYSIYIYWIGNEEADRIRKEMGLPPWKNARNGTP